ncbi:MAG: cytochrome-c peroxidase [Terriglobia bacterium]
MANKDKPRPWRMLALFLGAALMAAGCTRGSEEEEPAQAAFPQLEGYEAMKIPSDNPMSAAKVELGKQLFYDRRLSGDGSRACYDCHLAEHGLTDGRPTAIGAYEKRLPRSSPTLWNIAYHSEFYWDGRSPSLEAQVKGAWSGGNMGASGQDGRPSLEDICAQLNEIQGYRSQFQGVFGGPATPERVAMAIAAFERTIVANNSAWVRFRQGEPTALSEAGRRGYEVFQGKARCVNCHDGLLLTDLQYHNVGIGMDTKEPDLGRFKVTGNEQDKGAFKTPTLLDIAESAPYFHDGSVATLQEAVDLMLQGGRDNPQLDRANLLPPVKLTAQERADLLQFLRELSVDYTIPRPIPPQ